ncbi:MAG TPA: hypothetical protein VN698_15255 [Bacteroidia bacterium]|nr:hypothetical protein [Bacteroidia bacterium]
MIKLFSITGLFFVILTSCSPHAANNDANAPASSEGIDSPSITSIKKDSTIHNDTIVTPPDDNNMNKNNPDITK